MVLSIARYRGEFWHEFPTAVHLVIDDHYEDDMLDAANTIQDIIQLANFNNRQASFDIEKWEQNSEEVMKALGSEQEDESLLINMNLGYKTKVDCFTYFLRFNKRNSEVLKGNHLPKKRDISKILMLIFSIFQV